MHQTMRLRFRRITAAALMLLSGAMLTSVAAAADSEATNEQQAARARELAGWLKSIRDVGDQGRGSREAAAALEKLTAQDAAVLPEVLKAFEGAGPLGANYLRGAFETVADRALETEAGLPQDELIAFIENRKNNPRARRLAFEWVRKADAEAAEALVPGMLLDPSPELRREAVQQRIDRAAELLEAEKKKEAVALYREALRGAVDDDQVKEIVKPLKANGEKVDLQQHFGFLTRWQIIGPFNNRDKVGFDKVYPPEKEVDLDATYDGQLGEVKWTAVETDDDYGIIDIAEKFKNYKGSVMYAYTEYQSAGPQTVQFRLGTANAWKLWINGEFVFGREEYHRGMALDQYKVTAQLKPGRNTILFKICQNEQDQDWAQRYKFQIRVCDATGSAILPSDTNSTSRTGESIRQVAGKESK